MRTLLKPFHFLLVIATSLLPLFATAAPDATNDGIGAVKQWAGDRIGWAESDFTGSGGLRYGSPGYWGGEIVYQIQVDRFNNGDPDNDHLNLPSTQVQNQNTNNLWDIQSYRHGGDLQGILDRMDYFKDLGVSALWLTPILKHRGTYHGYCTSDFSTIDPGFGNQELFRKLVQEAHKRNIKVVMDVVVNHMCDDNTSYGGWANHIQCANDMAAQNWAGLPSGTSAQGWLNFGHTFWPALKHQDFFNRCGANSEAEMKGEDAVTIYGDFTAAMLDFNTRNHDFQEIFTQLHKYWIAYADVDGFRLDAAKHVTEDFIAYFSTEIRSYAKHLGKDNFFLVGEVAGSSKFIGRRLGRMSSDPYNPDDHGDVPQSLTNRMWGLKDNYLSHGKQNFPGLTAVYDFAHGGRARNSLRNEQWISNINDHFTDGYFQLLNGQQDARLNWNVLEIHDWPRFIEGANKRNPYKSHLGLSYLAAAQGVPVIYYGMEQGFNGDCHWSDIHVGDAYNQVLSVCNSHSHELYRQDMFMGPWRLGSSVGSIDDMAYIGHADYQHAGDWRVDPYLNRNNSVYKTARKFNYIRKSCDVLRNGISHMRVGWNNNSGIMAFSRLDSTREAVVIVNNASWDIAIDKIRIDNRINQIGGQKFINLPNGKQAWTGYENGQAYLYFSGQKIPGNSVEIFVHENSVAPWSSYLETHQCVENAQYPQDPGKPNQSPVAKAGTNKTVYANDNFVLDGSGSYDPDGSLVHYSWSNGLTGKTPSFSIAEPGTYEFTLTVTDDKGAQAADSVTITVLDSIPENFKRTIIFMYGKTIVGQDMFMRGGIDWGYSKNELGVDCGATPEAKWDCAMPIEHRHFINDPKRIYDNFLDWYGAESGQGDVKGSPLAWTTNKPDNPKNVESNGYGYTPLNEWGDHYWMLDVNMDCNKAVPDANGNRWFEVKAYISNGPGWEGNIDQRNTPYSSRNHFAQCGKMSVFRLNEDQAIIKDIPTN